MKTRLCATAVAMLVVLLAVPAAGSGGGPFKLYGQITWLDSDTGTIQVEVNAPDSLKEGGPVTVQTNQDTRLKECSEGAAPGAIHFTDLEVGRMVKITGEMDGAAFLAVSVIMY